MNRVVLCLVLSAGLFVSAVVPSLYAEENPIPPNEEFVSEFRQDKPWRKKNPDPEKEKRKQFLLPKNLK